MPETETAPSLWLRLSALGGMLACALVVSTATVGLGPAHRMLALVGLPPLAAAVIGAWVAPHRRLLLPTAAALGFFLAAIASGALVAVPGAVGLVRTIHVGFAALALAAAATAAVQSFRLGRAPKAVWRDYLTMTKPRIMTLLLWTGACGMIAGERGMPPVGLFAAAMSGLALACGGASALNHLLDADIDRLMGSRTERRPVAVGRVPPSLALEFGVALSALSFVLLSAAVNPLTALLALIGNLFYVFVYTRWLKRSTPQNIVIGGAAGAIPPLVGWAAATNSLALPAIALFVIVFVWTPPHFWALALLIRQQYERASIPMLPVVRGERETARQIVLYTLLLVAVTALPFAFGWMGVLYLVSALALGALFTVLALQLQRELTKRRASLLFHYSLLYLALLFTATAIDAVI